MSDMDLPINSTPLEEQHPSIEELEAWVAGDIQGERAVEITAHVSQCDMCGDIVEGLLEFDDEAGLAQKSRTMYSDFRQKNLKPDSRRKQPFEMFTGMSGMNTILLIIAALLLLTIIVSLFFLLNRKKTAGNSDPDAANRVDTMLAYDPSIAYREDEIGYLPDSGAVDSTIEQLLQSDPNVDYNYYDEDANTSANYRPQYTERVYVYNAPANDYVTSYTGRRSTNDGSVTPQSRYYGYDVNASPNKTKPKSQTIQVGNQILEIDNIVRQAQQYYNDKNYTDGIYFLDKYAGAVDEPVADLDYWLARMYAAKGEMSYARYYLERIASYSNPYQARAKKMLGEK